MKAKYLKRATSVFLSLALLVPSMNFAGTTIPAAAATTPNLIISEMCANSAISTPTDNTDAFEYIELVNKGTSSVNLQNYMIKMYSENDDPILGTTASAFRTLTLPSKTFAAGATMVVWLQTTETPTDLKQLDDFNSHYTANGFTSSVDSSHMIMLELTSTGLGNTGYRKIVLTNASSSVICYAKYNEGTGDDANANYDTTGQDTSIYYEFRENPIPTYKAMYKISSNQICTPGVNRTNPVIEITEIVANSSSAEAYEYVELHNTTTSDYNLQSYRLRYWANDSTYYDWDFSSSFTIPAGGCVPVWIYNTDNCTGKTLGDFNTHYHTNFTSSTLYTLASGDKNLPNTSKRAVEFRSDAGTTICKATYNDPADGDAGYDGRSIVYEHSLLSATNLRLTAINQDPSPGSQYQLLYGQLHGHSTVSDGAGGSPTVAYETVRDAGADFFSLSDHSADPTLTATQTAFNSVRQAAYNSVTESPGYANKFASLYGFEMTWNENNGWWGHMNTFNTSWINYKYTDYQTKASVPAHYSILGNDPESISQFNHPFEAVGTFGDYEYRTDQADGVIPLIETSSKRAMTEADNHNPLLIAYGFFRALDKGWHVAPTANNDCHDANWYVNDDGNSATTTDKLRTVVLAERPTRDLILDAIRNRRVYASRDTNLELRFTCNGQAMGSRLTNPSSLTASVDVYDPDSGDNISKISIMTSYGAVVYSVSPSSTNETHFTYDLTSKRFPYYLIMVEEADGDWAFSAPIWTTYTEKLSTTLSFTSSANNSPCNIVASVHNTTGSAISNVYVTFYRNEIAAENILASYGYASIAANGTITPTVDDWLLSTDVKSDVIYVKVYSTSSSGGASYIKRITVPQVLITEVVANSATSEAFEFIELYNNTKAAIDLQGYKIEYHASCGDKSDDVYTFDINSSFSIAAKSTAILWLNTSETYQKSDFLTHFGVQDTSANQAKIYRLSADHSLGNTGAKSIVLRTDTDANNVSLVICKAWYNEGMDNDPDNDNYGLDTAANDTAVTYQYPTGGSVNMLKTGRSTSPTPLSLAAGQVVS